jgi:hypothetical protein
MSEVPPPAGIRHGNWMVDIAADRPNDHCRYVNQRHTWVLPRRLRLEQAFILERDGHLPDDYRERFIRPTRDGLMAVAMRHEFTSSAITLPEDLDALRLGITNDREWLPFKRAREKSPIARDRFAYCMPSDKGRYILGVLQLFPSLPNAFSVLKHKFWRGLLHHFGAQPVQRNLGLRADLIKVLRKRLKQPTGPLRFESEEQVDLLSRLALHFGRMVPNAPRIVDRAWLEGEWTKLVDSYLKAHPKPASPDDDARIRHVSNLERSIQYLCGNEVLFQGHEWSCQSCHNRNWVGIDALARSLECEVCRHTQPAPVSGDWHFRPNPFLLNAYREHGVEAVLFALWQLSERARRSFYFAPSLSLWLAYPKGGPTDPDVEIDAVAVVDGKTYLVEGTTSAALDKDEIDQLVLAAGRIRPDVVLVACMDEVTDAFTRAVDRLKGALPSGIEIELLAFNSRMLDDTPYLPA